ncbi:MAG: MFS transporter, partial [Trueperella sp.]|nr:MFS transporter [Trueperella sp.]
GSGLYLMFYYIGSSVGGIVFGFGWDIGQWPMVLIMAASSLIVILVLSLFVSRAEPHATDAKMG